MKTVLVSPDNNTLIKVKEDSQFVIDIPMFGKDKRYVLELQFVKEGVSAEILGLFNVSKNRFLDLTTITRHMVPNTSCMTNIKTVLGEHAFSNYIGKILIDKKAQQTSSFLHDSVLVVGDNTHNNSQPILEIEADDVRASHGATTGRINEEQVYYLMSRGLSRRETEDLIIQGYFESMLSKIADGAVREKVRINIES